MRARSGLVTPSPYGPHVEQVGGGVGRQVVRVLREQGADDAWGILERFAELAEVPSFLAYAVFVRRTATAAALVSLGSDTAVHLGDALSAEAVPGTREALVVRALHDVANAGIGWLEVPDSMGDLRSLGFG
jgi:hypothetical protein